MILRLAEKWRPREKSEFAEPLFSDLKKWGYLHFEADEFELNFEFKLATFEKLESPFFYLHSKILGVMKKLCLCLKQGISSAFKYF